MRGIRSEMGLNGLGDNGDYDFGVDFYDESMVDYYINSAQDLAQDDAQFTFLDDGGVVDAYARTVTTADGIVYGDNTVSFLPGVAQSTINNIVAQLTAQAGSAAGRWLSKQVGGSTVLYRQNSGQIGTMDIKKLLLPAAVVAGIFFLENK